MKNKKEKRKTKENEKEKEIEMIGGKREKREREGVRVGQREVLCGSCL